MMFEGPKMKFVDAPKLEDDWLLGGDLGLTFDEEIVAALPVGSDTKSQPRVDETAWWAAIKLVGNASEAFVTKDAEILDLQSQLERQRQSAREEVDLLNAQIKVAHEETERALAEAERANRRAVDAENWLKRMTEALRDGFSPIKGGSDTARVGSHYEQRATARHRALTTFW
jgi:hypothetical protein